MNEKGSLEQANLYDEIPYPSHPNPQTHPNLLAVIATLFGMTPKDIHHCRVLELGAAHGANLIPMAYHFPHSHFVGIDLSEREVQMGLDKIKDLNLKNIELKHLDILEINQSLGLFDYIIVHGVYSWVPEAVRNKILDVCKAHLSPNGVAYVSYNTYPGWHSRGMFREMMLYHTRNMKDNKRIVTQAYALMNFLADSVPVENNAYGMLLNEELNHMKKWDEGYFRHDSLGEINHPVYLYQFVEEAAKHDLQYLGDANFKLMLNKQSDKLLP